MIMWKKIAFRWIKVLVLVYSIIGIVFYYVQDKIFFHPTVLSQDYQYNYQGKLKEVFIPVNDQSTLYFVQFKTPDTAKGVVLYFHGNRDNISHYLNAVPPLVAQGYEVWMLEYPGFGKATGNFTEQNLYEWALQLYKYARPHFQPNQIVIYGRSLGTGIAAQLASIRDCRQLILEAPYYDFRNVARPYLFLYPLNRMIPFGFPTFQYLQKVTAPVTLIHGTDDGVISYRNSAALSKLFKPGDTLITVKGGSHNDLLNFPEATVTIK